MPDLPPGAASRVSALFDAKAAGWSSKYVPGGPLTGRLGELSRAVRRQAQPGAAVLDLGCGTGELARHLAACGLRVTGCDISAAMLAAAAGSDLTRAVNWVILDPQWRALPFPAGYFDTVVAASVMEYLDDPVGVLRECARVLKPGGAMQCTVPNLRHPVRWLELPAWIAALTLPSGRPGRPTSRLAEYAAYLRLSRQRHSLRWWRAAALRAGLRWQDVPNPLGRLRPLRLLLLVRSHSMNRDR